MEYTIRKLKDGSFTYNDFPYEDIEELLTDLRDDLSGDSEEEPEESANQKMAKKITTEDGDE
jgi:hypothetical protein